MTGAAAASVKSPEAFRTISEVAEMLEVPQHVLRFWESRFAHIRPMKRAGGRRFYRPEDVDLLRGIRALLYQEGYTIKGVQKILREKGVRYTAEVGRSEQQKNGRVRKQPAEPASDIESETGLDALAGVRDASAEAMALDDDRQSKLESLLTELIALKQRLRTARAKVLM